MNSTLHEIYALEGTQYTCKNSFTVTSEILFSRLREVRITQPKGERYQSVKSHPSGHLALSISASRSSSSSSSLSPPPSTVSSSMMSAICLPFLDLAFRSILTVDRSSEAGGSEVDGFVDLRWHVGKMSI